MRDVEEEMLRYIDAIKATEEYREYERQKERVRQYPELKAQIDEYRRRNFEMQMSGDNVFERMERFEQEYAGFRENPVVADFLAAELAFCRMMQELNIEITESLNFE